MRTRATRFGRTRKFTLRLSEDELVMLKEISVEEAIDGADVLRRFIRAEHAKRTRKS